MSCYSDKMKAREVCLLGGEILSLIHRLVDSTTYQNARRFVDLIESFECPLRAVSASCSHWTAVPIVKSSCLLLCTWCTSGEIEITFQR